MPQADNKVGGPLTSNNFIFELQGVQLEQLKSVSGLEVSVEVIANPQVGSDGKWSMNKVGGNPKAPSIRVTRTMEEKSKNKLVTDWIQKAYSRGAGSAITAEKSQASITYRNAAGDKEIKFNLIGAWVSSWSAGEVSAEANGVIIETFTIECDRVEIA